MPKQDLLDPAQSQAAPSSDGQAQQGDQPADPFVDPLQQDPLAQPDADKPELRRQKATGASRLALLDPSLFDDGQQEQQDEEHQGSLRQPVPEDATWEDLELNAQEAKVPFTSLVNQLIEKTHASKESVKYTRVKNDEKGRRKYQQKEAPMSGMGPLKTQESAERKAKDSYDSDLGRVLDVVRGTLGFKDFKALTLGLQTIMKLQDELGFKVMRCKQTYTPVTNTLYGDIKLNIREPDSGHICELQLNVEAMIAAKAKGHEAYGQMREANPQGMPLGDLYAKSKEEHDDSFGQARNAVVGSFAAYLDARAKIEQDGAMAGALKLAREIGEALEADA